MNPMFHFARPSVYTSGNHRQGNPIREYPYDAGYSIRSAFDTNPMVAQEEVAIHQRLVDIEAQRHQTYYNPSPQHIYEGLHGISQGPQESRLAALRREVELEEQRYATAVRRQEEQALEARLHAARQRRQAIETSRARSPPVIEFVVDAEPQRTCFPHGNFARQRKSAEQELKCSSGCGRRPQINVNRAQTTYPSSEPPFFDLLSSLLGGDIHHGNSELAHSFRDTLQSGSSSTAKPHPVRKPNRLQTEQAAASQRHPEAVSLQDFFSTIVSLASELSRQESPKQKVPSQSNAGLSSVPATLKDNLERRLSKDDSMEIKDTIQAILASLTDAPTIPVASSSSVSDDTSKGKGKTETTPVSPITPLDTIRNIEAAYITLESDFTFPSIIDFTTPTPASDSDEVNESRLAYTSRNRPIRYFEQSLSGLITQLDEIATAGDEELRSKRKELVNRIEKRIQELDAEIERMWNNERALKAETEEKEKEQEEDIAETRPREASEEQSAYSSAASETTVRPYDVDSESGPEPTSTPTSTSISSEVPETKSPLEISVKADTSKEKNMKDSDSEWSEVDA